MNRNLLTLGLLGLAPLLGAMACSGKNLNDVGDLDSGGHAGSIVGDTAVAGSDDIGVAGDDGGAGRAPAAGGALAAGGAAGAHSHPAGGGGGPPIEAQGGEAGVGPTYAPLNCPACTVVAEGQDVHSIAADAMRVLWSDFGTRDALGNYNDDGTLYVRDLDAGTTNQLAQSISGPEWVGLSPTYAYVMIDNGPSPSSKFGVKRVPLAGGALESIQSITVDDYYPQSPFAAGGGSEYWAFGGAVYRIADAIGAAVETFVPARKARALLSDDTHLYFEDDAGEWSVPLTGGDPTSLVTSTPTGMVGSLLLSGDYIYGIESPRQPDNSPVYLTRLPKTGGTWKRVVQYTYDVYFSQLAIDGEKYFIDQPTAGEAARRLLQGSLSTPGSFQALATQRTTTGTWWGWKAWAWSRVGIFLATTEGLYLTPTK